MEPETPEQRDERQARGEFIVPARTTITSALMRVMGGRI